MAVVAAPVPITWAEVIVTAWLMVAVSPAPGTPFGVQTVEVAQFPDWFEV